jgi:membrane protein YdbS with pleckstrin-like domain
MPFRVKFGLTLVVALVAVVGWFYMGYLGRIGPQRAVAFLGPFMIVALWIFPEVARRPPDAKAQKKEAGPAR